MSVNVGLDREAILGILGLCCGLPLVVAGIGVIVFNFIRNRK